MVGLFALLCAACAGAESGSPHQANGMALIAARSLVVGTSSSERAELAERFDCHPTWLGDDLPLREVDLAAFWIDRHPVTNSQYLAFVESAGYPAPSWWGRWGGSFPAEYAEHPVTGVSGKDAAAYAKWAGKRLPSAEEWEAAVTGPERSVFAWGDSWPGPLKLQRSERIDWELPGTRPVGTGDCGRSVAGVEDFAGQVIEWVSNTVPHHGVQFQLAKGASWFHEDPVNFRVASGWYAYEGWRSSFTGFRCALDAVKSPPPQRQSRPTKTISATAALEQIKTVGTDGPLKLTASGGTSRHLSIHIPTFGRQAVSLTSPETIIWNGSGVMTWRKTPDMTWVERNSQRASYEMRFDELLVQADFIAHDDYVEQQFTARNLTKQAGSFRTSSCFNLQEHPMFYDCEQLRTYALSAEGEFVAMRHLSRGGNCVRWITGPSASELGAGLQWSVLAVVSRDGQRVIATGRGRPGIDFSIATNTLFTCLHTDSTVRIEPVQQASTRQFFWFVEGGLDDLLERIGGDLKSD
ncbi:MAG: SUMF1/EgtB/PvdO family nonheme iron enzyme [Sedimentisphaerales bacterium]|nr:SUMF1/EgtB/PvdO family nonheme iron enzyme [Sedimentisphaerales bacterium]